MSGQQPYDDPRGGQPTDAKQPQPYYGQGQMQPAGQDLRGYQPPGPPRRMQAAGKRYALRGAEAFWYVLMCIPLGAAYFHKLPSKKAACEIFSELQLDGQGPSQAYTLRGAEVFWYTLMCIAFGVGYFAKVVAKKAQWEVIGMMQSAPGEYREAIGRALNGSVSGRAAY
jgi:hypothetical protein